VAATGDPTPVFVLPGPYLAKGNGREPFPGCNVLLANPESCVTSPAASTPLTAPLAPPLPQRRAAELLSAYKAVRDETERRAAPLSAEDQTVQSMPDASPTKWHRAHTTWFFEQFLLAPHAPGYRPFHPDYAFLFNSYYVSAGPRHARNARGLLTRPSADDVAAYRRHVDAAMESLLTAADGATLEKVAPLI
jgi:hypothetical protein